MHCSHCWTKYWISPGLKQESWIWCARTLTSGIASATQSRTAAITASAKPLELLSFLDRGVPFRVNGDCGRLGQILMNLLSNAVKFTEKGEIVTRAEVTSLEQDEFTVHFSVSDTGIGIPADRLDSVFHEFEQAHSEIMGKYGGSGLGLAICARLVARMGGTIWAESEVGKGSTFHFTARFALAPECTGDALHPDFPELKGLRVLVVSHSSVCRDILEEFLRNWDMDPTLAVTGAAALEIVRDPHNRDRPFGVILIDSSMPEMSDLAFARQMLRDPGLGDAHPILLTTFGSAAQSVAASSLGIVHRIPKPPKLAELLTAMSRLLETTESENKLTVNTP